MAKNKNSSPTEGPKKDLLSRTEDSLVDGLLKYKEVLGLLIAAIFVVGTSWTGFNYYNKKQEESAQTQLSLVEQRHLSILKELDEAQQKAETEKKTSLTPDQVQQKEMEKLTPVVEQYKKVAKDHSSTKAGMISAINAANILQKHKKLTEAETLLTKTLSKAKKKSMFFGLLNVQLGTLMAEQNKCESALPYFQKIVGNKDFSYLHPQALLKQGVCYARMKQYDQARAAYERIINEFKGNNTQKTAKSLLRLLNVSNKGS